VKINHIAPDNRFVIPGRRSEAQANPESGNRNGNYWFPGSRSSAFGPMISAGMTTHMIRTSKSLLYAHFAQVDAHFAVIARLDRAIQYTPAKSTGLPCIGQRTQKMLQSFCSLPRCS
jgi:hypothetical protein